MSDSKLTTDDKIKSMETNSQAIDDDTPPSDLHLAKENAYHLEIQGIRPVPADQRTHHRILDNLTMWFSINTTISVLSVGMLASPVYGLNLVDSVATILVCNAVACIPGAFFVTIGQRYGLRQMVLTRYSFGLYGSNLPAVINLIVCIGWSTINSIFGGQLLTSVSDGKLPMWASILLLTFVTFTITVFGYRILHHYERWIWLPMWVIFFIVLGYGAKNMVSTPITSVGGTDTGNFLTFASSVVGYNPSWVTCSADYAVNQPVSFDRRVVFILAYLGSFLSTVSIQIIGAALTTTLPQSPLYEAAWNDNGVGGLIGAILQPLGGFGKFLLVLLAFGIVACNVPTSYSVCLSIQTMGKPLQKVPQWIWTIVTTIIYVILAIFGADHFSDVLTNFLLVLAYYCGPYAIILLAEHGIVRRGVYDLDGWDIANRLPIGSAAWLALIVGFCGALIGMKQTWFVGPLAKLIGKHAGDIGFELAIALTAIVYIPARLLERRVTGR